MSIQKILVPVDFSECSRNALVAAVNFGRVIQAELILLHAYHVPVPHVEAGAAALVQPLMEGYEEKVEAEFKDLLKFVPELDELSYEYRCVHGFATDAIHTVSHNEDIDLVIMGTKGASGVLEKLIGSITAQVIKESKCPVMAIPANADLKDIKTMALASDNRPVANVNVFDPLLDMARAYDSEIHVLNILKDESDVAVDPEGAVGKLLPEGVKQSYHYFSHHSVEKGIMDYIEENGIQVIGVLPRHHSLFERIFKTSLTEKLAFHTTIPLLAMHED